MPPSIQVLLLSCALTLPLAAQSSEAWTPLFTGEDLSAWRGYASEELPSRGWLIEDETLRHVAGTGGGDLVTRREFGDFELRWEWKVAAGANSGVIYRVVEGKRPSWHTGLEFQILDDRAHAGASGEHCAGALYDLFPAAGKTLKPAGEWNSGRVVARGAHLEHWINGTRVVTVAIGSRPWQQALADSKFASHADFARAARGRIALQDHGDDVWFRNIRVRELKAPAR